MNAFLQKQKERDQRYFDAGVDHGVQRTIDDLTMVLRDMGWGRTRIKRVLTAIDEKDKKYKLAYADHKEADLYQEKMDSELREVYGDDLVPFSERQEYVAQHSYNKPRKGWV